MKERDLGFGYKKLHDKDPVTYHLMLSRHGIKCGFCEAKEINQNSNTDYPQGNVTR